MLKPFTAAYPLMGIRSFPDKRERFQTIFDQNFYHFDEQDDSFSVHVPSLLRLQPRYVCLSDAAELLKELRGHYGLEFKAIGTAFDTVHRRHTEIETTDLERLQSMDVHSAYLNAPHFDIHFNHNDTTFILDKIIPPQELQRLDFIFNDMLLERKAVSVAALEDLFKKP